MSTTQTAKDKGWAIGDTVEVLFADTGAQQLKIVVLYDDSNVAGGTYIVGLPTYEENVQVQLDSSIFVKLAPGTSIEQGRAAIEKVTDGYPSADVQTKTEFADSIVGQITQLLVLDLRPAAAGHRHRPHRHREHAGPVDLRAHPRARSDAGGGHDPAADAHHRPLRGRDHRPARHRCSDSCSGSGSASRSSPPSADESSSSGLTIPVGQLLVVIVLAIVAGVVSAILPARRAARLNILQAIQTE